MEKIMTSQRDKSAAVSGNRAMARVLAFLLAFCARDDARRARPGDRRRRPHPARAAQLCARLASAGRRGGAGRDHAAGAGARTGGGGQYPPHRRRPGCTACFSTAACPSATMSPSMSCRISSRPGRSSPTARSPLPPSLRWMPCRRHHGGHARPHRRGAWRRAGERAVVTAIAQSMDRGRARC